MPAGVGPERSFTAGVGDAVAVADGLTDGEAVTCAMADVKGPPVPSGRALAGNEPSTSSTSDTRTSSAGPRAMHGV